ncbi:unnamed protein product [Protopolystoma xenopodis]|uniref:Uncharacterized protein n=1 Tax=Protopolystoma xenopodis TaxID=117903 RepID=A0A448XGG7_9PLAT|nr:unnamed protein product [Protopolystoma xenopodis]
MRTAESCCTVAVWRLYDIQVNAVHDLGLGTVPDLSPAKSMSLATLSTKPQLKETCEVNPWTNFRPKRLCYHFYPVLSPQSILYPSVSLSSYHIFYDNIPLSPLELLIRLGPPILISVMGQ